MTPQRPPLLRCNLTLLVATLIISSLTGCGQISEEQTAGSQELAADVNLHRQDSTKQYKFDIQLPEIIRTNAVLRDTLTKLVNWQQQSFTERARNDTAPPERPPWELQLEVTTQNSTRRFISVLGEGYEYMGGAHGAPFFVTLNYDRDNKELVRSPIC